MDYQQPRPPAPMRLANTGYYTTAPFHTRSTSTQRQNEMYGYEYSLADQTPNYWKQPTQPVYGYAPYVCQPNYAPATSPIGPSYGAYNLPPSMPMSSTVPSAGGIASGLPGTAAGAMQAGGMSTQGTSTNGPMQSTGIAGTYYDKNEENRAYTPPPRRRPSIMTAESNRPGPNFPASARPISPRAVSPRQPSPLATSRLETQGHNRSRSQFSFNEEWHPNGNRVPTPPRQYSRYESFNEPGVAYQTDRGGYRAGYSPVVDDRDRSVDRVSFGQMTPSRSRRSELRQSQQQTGWQDFRFFLANVELRLFEWYIRGRSSMDDQELQSQLYDALSALEAADSQWVSRNPVPNRASVPLPSKGPQSSAVGQGSYESGHSAPSHGAASHAAASQGAASQGAASQGVSGQGTTSQSNGHQRANPTPPPRRPPTQPLRERSSSLQSQASLSGGPRPKDLQSLQEANQRTALLLAQQQEDALKKAMEDEKKWEEKKCASSSEDEEEASSRQIVLSLNGPNPESTTSKEISIVCISARVKPRAYYVSSLFDESEIQVLLRFVSKAFSDYPDGRMPNFIKAAEEPAETVISAVVLKSSDHPETQISALVDESVCKKTQSYCDYIIKRVSLCLGREAAGQPARFSIIQKMTRNGTYTLDLKDPKAFCIINLANGSATDACPRFHFDHPTKNLSLPTALMAIIYPNTPDWKYQLQEIQTTHFLITVF